MRDHTAVSLTLESVASSDSCDETCTQTHIHVLTVITSRSSSSAVYQASNKAAASYRYFMLWKVEHVVEAAAGTLASMSRCVGEEGPTPPPMLPRSEPDGVVGMGAATVAGAAEVPDPLALPAVRDR